MRVGGEEVKKRTEIHKKLLDKKAGRPIFAVLKIAESLYS
jgi:hypothetical protein